MELENKELCKKCGGYCCKKSGCDYFVSDFEDLSYKGLLEILSTGNVSVVSFVKFEKLKNGKLTLTPMLYLRARNKDRDVIDLISIKKECSMLKKDGCSYKLSERPSGGVNLVPMGNKLKCFPKVDILEEIYKWKDYQKSLSRIVKRYTGLSVDAKIREDVYNLFKEIMDEEFDNVAIEERIDVLGMAKELIKIYPEEAKKAIIDVKKKIKL